MLLRIRSPISSTSGNGIPKKLKEKYSRTPSSEPKSLKELRRKLSRSLSTHDSTVLAWLSSRHSIHAFSQRLGKPEFAEACLGLWYGTTSEVTTNPSLADLLNILNLSRTGASFKGGMTAFRNFLLELAKRQGAIVPPKVECKRLFVEKGKFVGVQVAGRGNMIVGKHGILGCSLERVLPKINYTGTNWLSRSKKPLAPKGWKFTIGLTVQKESIPNGILPRAIWNEAGAPPVEIEIVEPQEFNSGKTNHWNVYLRTVLPYSAESLKKNISD